MILNNIESSLLRYKLKCEFKKSILILDCDVRYSLAFKRYLKKYEFSVNLADSIEQATNLYDVSKTDLIIMSDDIVRNDSSKIKQGVFYSGIAKYIVLTNSNTLSDNEMISFYEAGARDVIDKSIHPKLFLAKIRVLLFSNKYHWKINNGLSGENNALIQYGSVTIDKEIGKIIHNKQNLGLSKSEFNLLMLLIENPNRVISRENLYRSMLKKEYDGVNRSIDNTIFRIRKKFDDEGITQMRIKSIRGKGYLFSLELY